MTEKKEELRAAIEGKTTDYFSVEEEPEEVAEKKAAGAAKAIGIAGAVPRMGTTTQAIQLVKYLRYKGYKACYIEMNDHGYERGSNENQNKLVRRHIPKGTNFDGISKKEVKYIEDWINDYPRQMFTGKSAREIFERAGNKPIWKNSA